MKLKYLAYIFTVFFLHTHLFAHQVLKSLSDEEFEEQLISFAKRCGGVCFISDSDFKEIQEEMNLFKRTEKSSVKCYKNKKGSSKEVRPDNFDTDLYFLMKEKIEILNKEELVVLKTKLRTRIDSANAVVSLGNVLPEDVISTLDSIKSCLNKVNERLVSLEKEEKKEKQKKKELDERIAKWQPALEKIFQDIEMVLELKKNISLEEDNDKINILLLKSFKIAKDLKTRLIAIESKIPEIITMQSSDNRRLIDEFNSEYHKLNSIFNLSPDTISSVNQIINILHDVNLLFLSFQADRKIYCSISHIVSIEKFKVFQSQVKNNIIYLDRKIDKLKKYMVKLSSNDFNKNNILNIIYFLEIFRDNIFYILNFEIKQRYFKQKFKCFALFIKENFLIIRDGVESFEKSTFPYKTQHDSDFKMAEDFFKENNYLTSGIYSLILRRIELFNNLILKKTTEKSVLIDKSVEKELLRRDDESFQFVEKEEGEDDDLSCPSEFDYSSDDLLEDDDDDDDQSPSFDEIEEIHL